MNKSEKITGVNTSKFLRNKDLIDQLKLDSVTVIGLGGIGSGVIKLLALMGFKHLQVYDSDKLNYWNLSTTQYPHSMVNTPKAEAAKEVALAHGAKRVDAHNYHWKEGESLFPKVICCVDNMEIRSDLFEAWWSLYYDDSDAFFIDTRMDALAIEVVTVKPHHQTNVDYFKYWKPSIEIEDAPCTMKHTIFTGSIVAGLGVNQVFNLVGNRAYYAYIWCDLMMFNIKKEGLTIKGLASNSENFKIPSDPDDGSWVGR